MDKFIVQGKTQLKGVVEVSGSKNSALPILAASIMSPEPSIIHNVPHLQDIATMVQILETLGVRIERHHQTLKIFPENLSSSEAPYELVRKMRASICLLGPLLARLKKAKVSLPGGCVIGPRPVDMHLKGLHELHAKIDIKNGYLIADGSAMMGRSIYITGQYGSSVLATANCLMAATLTPGDTQIVGAACEPEIVDLIQYLKKMGASIEGAGSPQITIQGQKELKGAEHTIIPDRIEAGTFMIGAAMTQGEIEIPNARPDHLSALIDHLRHMRVVVETNTQGLILRSKEQLSTLDVVTLPFPGFPTDLQAQMMALMSVSNGISVITEKVFPERFMHVCELNRLGAQIRLEGSSAVIVGSQNLSAAPLMSSDLRASAALVLAGLVAEGETHIHRIYHIDRGYENLKDKLNQLGAHITRVPEV